MEGAEVASTPNAGPKVVKWTGGIEGLLMDCPVEAPWELASDWLNWQRWWPGNPKFELREGENRKVGCLRYVTDLGHGGVPGAWCNGRLLAIDDEKHFISYNVEENEAYGGLRGHIAKAQLRGTVDGKTMVEHFKYEVEPAENQTPETFAFMMTTIYKRFLKDLERGAQRLAAGRDSKPDHTTMNKDSTAIYTSTEAVLDQVLPLQLKNA